jgi:hypothetical protein
LIAETLFKLLFGHALADFALQTETMAKLKNRHNKPAYIPEGQKYVPTWFYWMSTHGLIHGGIVYLLTGNLLVGITETITHILIDVFKCENYTNPHIDQALHILLKVEYVIYLVMAREMRPIEYAVVLGHG